MTYIVPVATNSLALAAACQPWFGTCVRFWDERSEIVPLELKKDGLFAATMLVFVGALAYGAYKMTVAARAMLPAKIVPKVHSCATWALEKLRNLNIPEINKTITPGLFEGSINKLAHIPSFNVGDSTEAFRASKVLSKEVFTLLYREYVPNSVKNKAIRPCMDMIQHGTSDKRKGLLVGGSSGGVIGSAAAIPCVGISSVGLVIALGSGAVGATIATVGTESLKQRTSNAKEVKNEQWAEKVQHRDLGQHADDKKDSGVNNLTTPASGSKPKSGDAGCAIF